VGELYPIALTVQSDSDHLQTPTLIISRLHDPRALREKEEKERGIVPPTAGGPSSTTASTTPSNTNDDHKDDTKDVVPPLKDRPAPSINDDAVFYVRRAPVDTKGFDAIPPTDMESLAPVLGMQ
jgi:hypothetical protein